LRLFTVFAHLFFSHQEMRMEAAVSFLERMVLLGVAVFALYQCFQIGDRGWLSRPAAGWTMRVCLIALAAVCLFTVARLAGTS
jgi:bacteriorhodopsin